MRVAVVGSRSLNIPNLGDYLPPDTTEIISGGARGVDTCARQYALEHGISYTEYPPYYDCYGRAAPLKRNDLIMNSAHFVLIFWDRRSRGAAYVMRKCAARGIPHQVINLRPEREST